MLLTGELLEGLVAVPVGGGRARAGLEIDHSEPSGSRVAISRAGRRPPAHTAAGPDGARNTSGATSNTTTRHRTSAQAYKKPTSGSDVGLWWS